MSRQERKAIIQARNKRQRERKKERKEKKRLEADPLYQEILEMDLAFYRACRQDG